MTTTLSNIPSDTEKLVNEDVIAPAGSFPWALMHIQTYKRAYRLSWGNKGMYLVMSSRVDNLHVEAESDYAKSGVAVGTQYAYLSHIDLCNAEGNFVPWQPSQEDMVANDWMLVEFPSVDKLYIKGNMTIGMYRVMNYYSLGYSTEEHTGPMGAWQTDENTTLMQTIDCIQISDYPATGEIEAGTLIMLEVKDYQLMVNFKKQILSKKLAVKCNGGLYKLGVINPRTHMANIEYNSSPDLFKLQELFDNNIGNTFYIEFYFVDDYDEIIQ